MSFHILEEILRSDEATLIETDPALEAELLYNLLSLLRCVRPSLALQMARQAQSSSQFIKCAQAMTASTTFTEDAVTIAEQAEGAVADDEGRRAKNVYRLILTAARDARENDPDWQAKKAQTLRIAGWSDGGEE